MIQFEHVSKQFPDGTLAVAELSLTIPARQTSVLLGSSGSGKTTLLKLVNRMLDPTSGRVLIDGEDVAGQNPVQLRRRIGYVMQHGGLLPHRTVLDNIATVPVLRGEAKAIARERARALMPRLGLGSELAGRYPHQLSGGQAQRVGVARALAGEPNILLMDEPFAAVDPIVRSELQAELVELQASELRSTIVFVTHDVTEALRLADRLAVFSAGGRLEQFGSPSEVVESPATEFVADFVGVRTAANLRRSISDASLLLDEFGRPVGRLAP